MAERSTIERGAAAEAVAALYLEARGLKVLERNLRCRAGELDLVCLEDGVIVIVEVRQRASADFGGALASVTWRKQRKLIRATEFLRQRRPEWRARALRFDVIAVQGGPDGTRRMDWIRDAFRVDGR
ncbi:MAG TPA: YraN family protein [Steroidobacteraceae bacterium]|nr:YraN family protein [Steroidobacteraceae bacterium]